MSSIVALLVVSFFAYFIIRTGAKALEMTGMSRDPARFQALSAFFGAGFTTGESEMVVNHPVRRRIIRDMIVVGNIGVMTLIASVVVTLTNIDPGNPRESGRKAVVVIVGLSGLWLLSRTPLVTNMFDRFILYSLRKSGAERELDYEQMLRVRAGFSVSEIGVDEDDWLSHKTLAEAELRREGINVLGVVRGNGGYVGSPRGTTLVLPGDTLIVYGDERAVRGLAARKHGPEAEEERRAAREAAEARRAHEGEDGAS